MNREKEILPALSSVQEDCRMMHCMFDIASDRCRGDEAEAAAPAMIDMCIDKLADIKRHCIDKLYEMEAVSHE